MQTLLTLARTGLFFICIAGWCTWLNSRFHIDAAQTPVLAFCGLGVCTYFAALLNICGPVQALLYACGFVLLFLTLWREKGAALRRFCRPSLGLFAVASAWTMLLMRGALVSGHDNFAHWAMMAKSVITNGRLPNTINTAIEYVDYPPATALWVKFVCDFIGTSDGTMLFAQAMLALACVLALAPLCKKSWAAGLGAVGAGAFLLTANPSYGSMMVDGLLSLLAIAALAIGVDQASKGALSAAVIGSTAVLCFLAVTKSSGMFFVLFVVAMLSIWLAQTGAGAVKCLAYCGAAVAVPAFAWLLWNRHVALVYPNGAESKHAVSAQAYRQHLAEKTPQDLAQFKADFFAYWGDFSQTEVLIFWLCVAMFLLVCIWLLAGKALPRARLLWGIGAAIVLTGGYIAGLYATYLFSMPVKEMLVLASIGRYTTSFSLCLLGTALILLLSGAAHVKKKMYTMAVCLIGCMGLAVSVALGQLPYFYDRAVYQDTEQRQWIELKNEYGLPEGASYLIYTNAAPVDGWGDQFVARYVFNSDTVDFWQYQKQAPDLDTICYGYDYIVFYKPDTLSEELLEAWGFDPHSPYLETILFSAQQDKYLQEGIPLPEGALTH